LQSIPVLNSSSPGLLGVLLDMVKSMWQAADVFALVTTANILHDWNQFALPRLPQLLSMASMHLSMLWQKGDMNTS